MNKKFSVKMAIAGTLASAMSPFIALAQAGAPPAGVTDVESLFSYIHAFFNSSIPILISMAVLYFVWSVFRYVGAGDNPEKRAEGAKLMVYAVVSIFVMVSVWGLVNILVNTFGLSNVIPPFPKVPTIP
ncbi:MAG: hypothetical protein COZ49_04265 [Candidatus Yonathbacteria bacterium CG_4_10_14_3_um_filter_47_65]|nr:MAG: hypothetical protein COX54_01850 [Candidatus Yonathbacteria bacterium CG23_combo_of_CG06-09_8_20_14_all_46_18]PIX56037.1 MAG: hypothetical protein COZ49_04265 [Candidatus Yonathbacteria bacterium CG_4_10_14_3_um_filter_47_65]